MENSQGIAIRWSRLILAALATVLISFVVFGASFFVVPVDMMQWQAEYGRLDGDPLRALGTLGHVLEGLLLALGYFLFVRSRRLVVGAAYGFGMMAFLSASDLTVLAAFRAASPDFTLWMIPVNLVVGLGVGCALAWIYRAP